MIMKVDLYFAGKEGRHIAAYIAKIFGTRYDTTDAGVIALTGIDFHTIPERLIKTPEIMKKMEVRDSETGDLISPKYPGDS